MVTVRRTSGPKVGLGLASQRAARCDAVRMLCRSAGEDTLGKVAKLARRGRFDYPLVELGFYEPLPVAEPCLGRRTVLTFPLFPPPQKN